MMQTLVQQRMAYSTPPQTPHYPMHSSFNYGSFKEPQFDPDKTQDGL